MKAITRDSKSHDTRALGPREAASHTGQTLTERRDMWHADLWGDHKVWNYRAHWYLPYPMSTPGPRH